MNLFPVYFLITYLATFVVPSPVNVTAIVNFPIVQSTHDESNFFRVQRILERIKSQEINNNNGNASIQNNYVSLLLTLNGGSKSSSNLNLTETLRSTITTLEKNVVLGSGYLNDTTTAIIPIGCLSYLKMKDDIENSLKGLEYMIDSMEQFSLSGLGDSIRDVVLIKPMKRLTEYIVNSHLLYLDWKSRYMMRNYLVDRNRVDLLEGCFKDLITIERMITIFNEALSNLTANGLEKYTKSLLESKDFKEFRSTFHEAEEKEQEVLVDALSSKILNNQSREIIATASPVRWFLYGIILLLTMGYFYTLCIPFAPACFGLLVIFVLYHLLALYRLFRGQTAILEYVESQGIFY
ncbi:uncharacterized protein NDAI_0B01790 [Naumovozyma dairenensis CBS 421]|uniref:Uncharacterized protein n=1 Tax=Naumovozyma dairenensis (strain ATCC 10597 / BCRC 20456 / CBS 421 / NBRC 0211 / NRRL Y-12639) TaxID=1071378 RepID=G0W602_NAUDC|nr:hypothetical protein NDAI_0B01790 [Naumovozyma dairenensis CBS 421]CCD23213.1 hypothetical protein NDAI_0B01790 [Naumovozyma dairenensis CBS 421]